MAKDNIFTRVKIRLERAVKGVSYLAHAKEAADRVRTRTRTGSGVEGGKRGGGKYSFKAQAPLSAKYVKWRKKSSKLNKMKTTPTKNNLTLTGQLLDSIVGKANGSTMYIEMKDNRNDGVNNTDIIRYQSKLGRDFFELTDKEVKGLKNSIKKDLIKSLRKTRK